MISPASPVRSWKNRSSKRPAGTATTSACPNAAPIRSSASCGPAIAGPSSAQTRTGTPRRSITTSVMTGRIFVVPRAGEQRASGAGGRLALDAAAAEPDPDRQRQQHHGEAEQQILDRRVDDAPADDGAGIVDDDVAAGQDAVGDQLEDENDRVRRPEHHPGDQAGTQDQQIDRQRAGHPEQRGDRVGHSSPAGRRSAARTASKPRIAQTGTTRKNSTSSSGSPPGRTMPVVCAGSNVQCPAAMANRSQITKTTTTGSSVSSSRRRRRNTLTLSTGSSQTAAARQPARTDRYARCRIR